MGSKGNHSGGWEIRWRKTKRGGYYQARFSFNGQRFEETTGVSDKSKGAEARREAQRIYDERSAGIAPVKRNPADDSRGAIQWMSDWLDSLPGSVRSKSTLDLYEKYVTYWLREWTSLSDITDRSVSLYVSRRLKEVRGKTVRNEASALRRCLSWLHENGAMRHQPTVPAVEKSRGGTPYKDRRRVAAPEYSPEEIERLIAAMPSVSGRGGWAVRARAIVAYWTSLRPETLDVIAVPEHYVRGATTIIIPAEDDKEGMAREIPLPGPAMEALEEVAPDAGLIFGKHRLDPYIRSAAEKVLPPHKSRTICMQHLRSAGITHALERSGNLPGVQYIAGHTQVSTTARYVRPSLRAAQQVAESAPQPRGRSQPGSSSGSRPPRGTWIDRFLAGKKAPAVGLEPTAVSRKGRK